jgi:hypothetical protein
VATDQIVALLGVVDRLEHRRRGRDLGLPVHLGGDRVEQRGLVGVLDAIGGDGELTDRDHELGVGGRHRRLPVVYGRGDLLVLRGVELHG